MRGCVSDAWFRVLRKEAGGLPKTLENLLRAEYAELENGRVRVVRGDRDRASINALHPARTGKVNVRDAPQVDGFDLSMATAVLQVDPPRGNVPRPLDASAETKKRVRRVDVRASAFAWVCLERRIGTYHETQHRGAQQANQQGHELVHVVPLNTVSPRLPCFKKLGCLGGGTMLCDAVGAGMGGAGTGCPYASAFSDVAILCSCLGGGRVLGHSSGCDTDGVRVLADGHENEVFAHARFCLLHASALPPGF